MKKVLIFIIIFVLFMLTSCTTIDNSKIDTSETSNSGESSNVPQEPGESSDKSEVQVVEADATKNTQNLINTSGSTVQERIRVPEGFERVETEPGSYGQYLRDLPVRQDGAPIKLYNGDVTGKDVHAAVLDIDVGTRDLQQCADAIIRLRAEYLYGLGMYEKIHFNFTNGFNADYTSWMNGKRIVIDGNKSYWVKKTEYSREYNSFRKYLDLVFAYAGTLSLSKEMVQVDIADMQIGDVFIKGATPGHAVLIMDMAQNKETGEKLFLTAQSYMPAQDIHILKNNNNLELSPWYPVKFGEILSTPEWEFDKGQLMRFKD